MPLAPAVKFASVAPPPRPAADGPKSLLQRLVFAQPAARKTPEIKSDEAEALLQRLSRERWERLRLQADDPLALLYNAQTSQWTVGWDPETDDCILLVWELHSWQEKPGWSLYRNGELLLREAENASRPRSALMHRLLESDQLPCITSEEFLERLISYRHPPAIREFAGRCLLATMLVRPEVFSGLKGTLFSLLEADLGSPEWPLLDVMKLHRVSSRTVLLRVFRELSRMNIVAEVRDNTRLVRAMALLEEDYVTLGCKISPLMRTAYDTALTDFRQTVMTGHWRARLSLKPPRR